MNQTMIPETKSAARRWNVVETVLIFLVFFLVAGWLPPDVNEAHYLAKAKHYWQPEWCAGDTFLESADAHLVFYWTFGWLTLLAPLSAVAWIGRIVTWGLLAWSWQRLSWTVSPKPLVSVLSAALMLTFLQYFHMAGEWIVGGVEAKGMAYVFVFLGVTALLRQRWKTVWIWLGIASSFHVLVGGWSVVAAGCAWISCRQYRPPLASLLPWMLIGLVLALPGLVPALALSVGSPPELVRQANWIYVYQRLPHHLVFHHFSHWMIARHVLLLILWLVVCFASPCEMCRGRLGQRPLRGFVGGAVAIALCGIAIDQSMVIATVLNPSTTFYLDIAASLLKYYWYRLSDAFLPIGTALAIVALIDAWNRDKLPKGQWALVVTLLFACIGIGSINLQRWQDPRPGADRQLLPQWPDNPAKTRQTWEDWCRTCQWAKDHTPADARFLTPYSQQTFKWYAERSEVCSWKDVPQDATSVVAWWKLHRRLYPGRVKRFGLVAHGEDLLLELADDYDADYVILNRHSSKRPLSLTRIYPGFDDRENSSFEIYRLPRAEGPQP